MQRISSRHGSRDGSACHLPRMGPFSFDKYYLFPTRAANPCLEVPRFKNLPDVIAGALLTQIVHRLMFRMGKEELISLSVWKFDDN